MTVNQQIISKIKVRHESGLNLLYKYYSNSLYGISYRILKNEAFAEDCLQQSFLKIWNSIDQYDESKSTLYTWMANIVRNNAIDIRRLKSFQKEEKTETIDPLVHIHNTSNQNSDILDAELLLKGMDDKYKEVLHYLYLEGYSQRDLSKKLDIPLGTIKSRVKKAIELLRTKLESEKNLFIGAFVLSVILIIILLL